LGRNSISQEINKKTKIIAGSIKLSFIVWFLIVLAGAIYLYSINSSAVKGNQMQKLEKEITNLKSQNEQLRIKEAELRSLYRIEEESRKLNMSAAVNITYIEDSGPMAMNQR
jgi:cell division protein FtsL